MSTTRDSIQKASALAALAMVLLCCDPLLAQDPAWKIVKPSNTGIPGEEVRVVRWGPDGKLWVAARWPFWQEGGIGVYDLETQVWSVWSNWETPIPSEYINDIEFDASGATWIATAAGLVKYDGQDWTVYDPTNSPLVMYNIRNISIAPDGHVWINNSDSHFGGDAIYDFDGVSTWTPYRVPDELPWEAPWEDLSSVLVDHLGHVWVANDVLPGLAEYDGVEWTLHGDDVRRFATLVEDHDGNIWMRAGVGGGNSFFKFDRTRFTEYPISTTPLAIAVDDDGAVYTGDWFGNVRRTTDGGRSWTFFLTGLNQVANIAPDPSSTDIWIGTFGALGHFRRDGEWVRDYNSYNSGMPWYWVDYMSTDRDGYFWVATGEAGLSRFDGLRWRNWGDHNAGAEPYPFAGNEPMGGAYEDRNGVHWFGGNGIARWHSETGEFSGFWNWETNPGMGVTLFPFFAEDAAGNLFAADEYGVTFRFDPEIELWVREPVDPYAPSGLPGMQADSLGNIWVAAWFDIHKWDGAAWSVVELPYRDYFFDLGGINVMDIGPDDVFWFGTGEGLVRWDGETFTLYDPDNTPLPAYAITGIDVRRDGLIGVAASDFGPVTPFPNGVCIVDGAIEDPASWSVYSYETSPLPHYQLGRVAWDGQGHLWTSALSEGCAVLLLDPPSIPGDCDGDGTVGLADYAIFATCLTGPGGESLDGCDTADMDGDQDTDIADFDLFQLAVGG